MAGPGAGAAGPRVGWTVRAAGLDRAQGLSPRPSRGASRRAVWPCGPEPGVPGVAPGVCLGRVSQGRAPHSPPPHHRDPLWGSGADGDAPDGAGPERTPHGGLLSSRSPQGGTLRAQGQRPWSLGPSTGHHPCASSRNAKCGDRRRARDDQGRLAQPRWGFRAGASVPGLRCRGFRAGASVPGPPPH